MSSESLLPLSSILFYQMILGKNRVNINYIESHTQTKLSVLGKGSIEENNDPSLPFEHKH